MRETFIKNLLLFSDVKVYDTTWKRGTLRDLHELGFLGRLLSFISNFLSDRIFQVNISFYSFRASCTVGRGPQRSILFPILFDIKINYVKAVLNDSL